MLQVVSVMYNRMNRDMLADCNPWAWAIAFSITTLRNRNHLLPTIYHLLFYATCLARQSDDAHRPVREI